MQSSILSRLGIGPVNFGVWYGDGTGFASGAEIDSLNPATGTSLARVKTATQDDYNAVVERSQAGFRLWRLLPPPRRGEIVRQLGNALREARNDLGMLITLETGKIRAEGLGEVQEMIDICDLAVGLSRQLYGLTMASERREHRMFEQWHPLGTIGVITAFNFPAAVWAWNAAVAAVCGDTIVWKPSLEAPLTAIAIQMICDRVMAANGVAGVFSLCVGDADPVGTSMARDRRLPLVSATGSCRMGRQVAAAVGARLGRTLLELGGNNAAILTASTPRELALRAVVFAAVGTAGQRCTTLRRLLVHESIADGFLGRLARVYESLKIGDPATEEVLVGPLISERACQAMDQALKAAVSQGGQIVCGGRRIDRPGYFVSPCIVRATPGMPIVREETFAPILYVMTFNSLEEAIEIHNSVDQGLSSAIFTDRLVEAETFLSPRGSDCGIANVNVGTSGAEIGGAFGGEKDTGGGREAGADSWKAYMRRQTCTVNWGAELPLAQGIRFEID